MEKDRTGIERSSGDQRLSQTTETGTPAKEETAQASQIQNAYITFLLDSAPDAILWAESDHRIFRVNPSFSRLFGYTAEESLGRNVDDLIAPNEVSKEASAITRRVSEGETVRLETIRYRKDGSPLFVDLMVAQIRMGDQRIGVCASYRDISQRKKVEAALRESHNTLLTVLDSIDATIYAADMTTHEVLFANKCMTDSFGRDLTGDTCWKVFRSREAPCEHCTNDKLLDRDGKATGVIAWEGRNPVTRRWYMNYDRAIPWIDGRMVRLQVATDITALKEAEGALRREKEYLTALHETSLGVIGRLDPGELLEAILARAANLVGIQDGYIYLYDEKADELVMKVVLGRYRPLLGYRIKKGEGLSGKVFLTGEPMLVEDYGAWTERLPHPGFDGLQSVVGVPFRAGSKVAGIMGLGCFGGGCKLGQAEMKILARFAELSSIALENASLHSRLREELEQRKKAETERAGMERQLLQAQKMEAIGTLAAGLAHDFNNLLMGVQGNASLMLSELNEDHRHHERLRNIEEYVRRGAELTRQLLGFARGGKIDVKATDLNALMRNSAALFIRTKRELVLQASYQEDLWPVQVDQGQINQVLLNIYINAWQAMPGGGTLTVSTENVTMGEQAARSLTLSPGKYVRLLISDSGVGMDDKTRVRIFEPFFTTKKAGQGTGLGLAGVYGIVKNHGGAIEVESQVGEGTTFRIHLPASEGECPPPPKNMPETVKGSGTILLIDDEEMIIRVAGEILEKIGFRVLTATSGKEAVELFKKSPLPIDLVVLDIVMPEMSGAQVFEKLKEINPGVRVLLSSGYSMEGQARELLKKGCQGFIQKPFGMSELSKKIREVMEI